MKEKSEKSTGKHFWSQKDAASEKKTVNTIENKTGILANLRLYVQLSWQAKLFLDIFKTSVIRKYFIQLEEINYLLKKV